jgi:hypothetical protein
MGRMDQLALGITSFHVPWLLALGTSGAASHSAVVSYFDGFQTNALSPVFASMVHSAQFCSIAFVLM